MYNNFLDVLIFRDKRVAITKFFLLFFTLFHYILCTRKPKLPNLRLQERGLAKSDKHHHDGMLGTNYILESLDSMFVVVVVEVELLTCLLSISKYSTEKFYLHSNRYLVRETYQYELKLLRLWVLYQIAFKTTFFTMIREYDL